jgi:phosphoribosylanthranilate isomerase
MFTDEGRAVQVKICGITNAEDAQAAVAAGADALGVNFHRGSRRYVSPAVAKPWLEELAGRARRVAIVVNPTWEEALEIASLPFIDALQLHGQETPEFCERLAAAGIRFAKALPALAASELLHRSDFHTRTIVLDSASTKGFGGTGEIFPWELAAEFVESHRQIRVVLAGGLTPENVAAGIAAVRPFAVDVSSGVEASPGRKDPGKLGAFLAAARAV